MIRQYEKEPLAWASPGHVVRIGISLNGSNVISIVSQVRTMRCKKSLVALLVLSLSALLAAPLNALETIRIGTLKFGTVNWELDTVMHHGLDRKHGVAIEIMPFANKQAAHIVFQSEEADIIVTDWLWVSRERGAGKTYRFIPYSSALGAIMTPPDSKAKDLRDLRGLRVGVAGGPLDKSWLLTRAWAQRKYGFDPLDAFDVQYAAPPLLNGQIERGRLDAVLNFWHYSARLEAQGYRRLVEISTVVEDLAGYKGGAMVGYVFRQELEQRHPGIVGKFVAAIGEARERLLRDDAEWERLRPLMRVENDPILLVLRDHYRKGIPQPWSAADLEGAKQLMRILSEIGGDRLTGGTPRLDEGTFWK